jgi:hypothetical protein
MHIIGMELMGAIRTIGSKLAWLLLLPGNSACRAMGLKEAESSDLIRMLVNSLASHRGVAGIEMKLFDRWRGLFHETSREVFVDDLADAFLEKAACITESLELALFYRPDRHWPGKAS